MSIENLLSEGIKATPPSFVRGILKAASTQALFPLQVAFQIQFPFRKRSF